MALMKLTANQPETPYFWPPPIHIRVLKPAQDHRNTFLYLCIYQVISWDIQDGVVKPQLTKKNTVAAITDGETVAKITLFEEFSSKVKEGMSYMMRGHELRGQAPPYLINITAKTQFFKAPALAVTEALITKAEELLDPPSPATPLKMSPTFGGLMTVEGEVVECSAVRKVVAGKQQVPIRTLQLKQDGHTMTVSLWREASIHDVHVGDQIKVSHVKVNHSAYGVQLQTTSYTKIETKEDERTEVTIVGVATAEQCSALQSTQLQVLLQTGETLFIEGEMWKPYEEEFEKATITVSVKIKGKLIVEIKKKQNKYVYIYIYIYIVPLFCLYCLKCSNFKNDIL
ncbi:sorting nexin-1/2 [Sarotherodon galilaeus]